MLTAHARMLVRNAMTVEGCAGAKPGFARTEPRGGGLETGSRPALAEGGFAANALADPRATQVPQAAGHMASGGHGDARPGLCALLCGRLPARRRRYKQRRPERF